MTVKFIFHTTRVTFTHSTSGGPNQTNTCQLQFPKQNLEIDGIMHVNNSAKEDLQVVMITFTFVEIHIMRIIIYWKWIIAWVAENC